MRDQRLSVKRRPVKKGAFRTLFANVSRKNKRHRAATATASDFEGDVPNVGVARALVVILLIHVVAIAGIFVHSRWIDKGTPAVAESAEEAPKAVSVKPAVAAPAAEEAPLPKIRSGDSLYTVGSGDTYANIAERFGVAEESLRKANDNILLRAGRYLRIPPKRITAVEPVELAALGEGRPTTPASALPMPATPVRPEAGDPVPGLVTTDAARAADARAFQPVSEVPAETPAASGSAGSYVVKSGDTFWAIAQKHGVKVDAVMKANGIDDPKRLKPGMKLVIPN